MLEFRNKVRRLSGRQDNAFAHKIYVEPALFKKLVTSMDNMILTIIFPIFCDHVLAGRRLVVMIRNTSCLLVCQNRAFGE